MQRTRAFAVAALAGFLVLGLASPAGAVNNYPFYWLAWDSGTPRETMRGYGDGGHSGIDYYAWDFRGDDFLIRASRAGTVVDFRDTTTPDRGGCNSDYGDEANFVRILHADGKESGYFHLKQGSVSALGITVGGTVPAYAAIGRTGDSGYWCGSIHLHQQIQNQCSTSSGFCQSIAASFLDSDVLADHANGVPDAPDDSISSNHPQDRRLRFKKANDPDEDSDVFHTVPLSTNCTPVSPAWEVSDGGDSGWRHLNCSAAGLSDVDFGDFDGDGLMDVFRTVPLSTNCGSGLAGWEVSKGGNTAWDHWNCSSVTLPNMAFGDFDSDGRTDVFTTLSSDPHCSGSTPGWHVNKGGSGSWTHWNCSSLTLPGMRFGDFDADGKTDVFTTLASDPHCSGSAPGWHISKGGNEGWSHWNCSSAALADMAFGDFDGGGATDIFITVSSDSHCTGSTPGWHINKGGNSPTGWSHWNCSAATLSQMGFGDFDGDAKADVFITLASDPDCAGSPPRPGWHINSGGNTAYWTHRNCSSAPLSDLRFGTVRP